MDCPICGEELNYHDYYGRIASHQDGKVKGDIYKCENEDCEGYNNFYHVLRDGDGELLEGYPC